MFGMQLPKLDVMWWP